MEYNILCIQRRASDLDNYQNVDLHVASHNNLIRFAVAYHMQKHSLLTRVNSTCSSNSASNYSAIAGSYSTIVQVHRVSVTAAFAWVISFLSRENTQRLLEKIIYPQISTKSVHNNTTALL